MAELAELIRSVPYGKCTTYGRIGAALNQPTSGFLVGRMIARLQSDVPWWRVVAQNGGLPINKKDPKLATHQQDLLAAEGVMVLEGTVDLAAHLYIP